MTADFERLVARMGQLAATGCAALGIPNIKVTGDPAKQTITIHLRPQPAQVDDDEADFYEGHR